MTKEEEVFCLLEDLINIHCAKLPTYIIVGILQSVCFQVMYGATKVNEKPV